MLKDIKEVEKAQKIFQKYFENKTFENKYIILIMWSSPLTSTTEYRTASFEHYPDAEEYIKFVRNNYDRLNLNMNAHIEFSIYINGELVNI